MVARVGTSVAAVGVVRVMGMVDVRWSWFGEGERWEEGGRWWGK